MKLSKQSILKYFLSLFLILSVSSCVSFDFKSDVSDQKLLWGGFIKNAEYELKRDVFLIKPDNNVLIEKDGNRISGDLSERLALTPEDNFHLDAGLYSAPDTIKSYEKNPIESVKKDYDSFVSVTDVVGIVRKGTIVQFSRVEKTAGYSWWWGFVSGITYYAKITNGSYSGSEVNIEDLSIMSKPSLSEKYITKEPNPSLLKLINK